MKKTIIIILIIAIVFLVIGFYIGMSNDAQMRILDSSKSKVEMQLAKYKHAQEVCGKDNVIEETKYISAVNKPTGDYTCEDFKEAAMTPEEKETAKKLETLDNQYSEYRYDGGVLNFRDWKRVTKQ